MLFGVNEVADPEKLEFSVLRLKLVSDACPILLHEEIALSVVILIAQALSVLDDAPNDELP